MASGTSFLGGGVKGIVCGEGMRLISGGESECARLNAMRRVPWGSRNGFEIPGQGKKALNAVDEKRFLP